MISNIFSLKLTILNSKGYQILDLWQQSIRWLTDKLTIDSTILVTDKFRMRPDLLSQVAWGDAGNADLLMKFNHISNPFSIDSGMIMIVPSYEEMLQQLYQPDATFSQAIVTTSSTTSSIQFKNVEKKAYNSRNSSIITPISTNSPNLAEPGDQQIQFVNGQVIFGPTVSTNANNTDIPLSKAALIQKITSNSTTKTA